MGCPASWAGNETNVVAVHKPSLHLHTCVTSVVISKWLVLETMNTILTHC